MRSAIRVASPPGPSVDGSREPGTELPRAGRGARWSEDAAERGERRAQPERPHASAGRRRRHRLAAAVCACAGLSFALLAFGGAARPSRLRAGPLSADHVISHRPADDCNYVGAPAAQPGDVWMDATPAGFLLTFTAEGYWLPMCVNGFTDISASIVCQMLGFQGASTHFNSQLHNASLHGLAPGVACSGSETTIASCARDPDFEKSWSDCRRYPEAMAVKLTCYGDIAARRENNYELGKRFTPELKTAVRRCGSSQVLTGLMNDIRNGVPIGGDERGASRSGPLGSTVEPGGGAQGAEEQQQNKLGKILGPVLSIAGAVGAVAGGVAGSHHQQLDAQGPAAARSVGAEPAALGSRGPAAGCSCPRSLVGDLHELAAMRGDGLLTQEEYSLAKGRVLGSQ